VCALATGILFSTRSPQCSGKVLLDSHSPMDARSTLARSRREITLLQWERLGLLRCGGGFEKIKTALSHLNMDGTFFVVTFVMVSVRAL
jgi:hypothetical protein